MTESLVFQKRKTHNEIEELIGWARTNLNCLRDEISDLGPKGVMSEMDIIKRDLREARPKLWDLTRPVIDRLCSDKNYGSPAPLIGAFVIPDRIEGEERVWLETQFAAIEDILKEMLALAASRDDIPDSIETPFYASEWIEEAKTNADKHVQEIVAASNGGHLSASVHVEPTDDLVAGAGFEPATSRL